MARKEKRKVFSPEEIEILVYIDGDTEEGFGVSKEDIFDELEGWFSTKRAFNSALAGLVRSGHVVEDYDEYTLTKKGTAAAQRPRGSA